LHGEHSEEVQHDCANAGTQDPEDEERDHGASSADREPLENEWEPHPSGARANNAHDRDLITTGQDGEPDGVDDHSEHCEREADHDNQPNDAQRTRDRDETLRQRTAIKKSTKLRGCGN